jgi:C1A family cysteine protease
MNQQSGIGGYRAGAMPHNVQKIIAGSVEVDNLPPKVDMRKFLSPVETQIGNSCVANALTGAYEYLANRALGSAEDVSRLFVYYNARALEGMQADDCGSVMSHAIESLKRYGACSEKAWPNNPDKITKQPPREAYIEASKFKIKEAQYLETDLDAWRHTLAQGYPIAFALNTFESFDEAMRSKGRVPMPKRSDNVRESHGWHAMLCVGYSDPDQMFIIRNSWSERWGDKGYAYIPYDYVMNPDYNGHDSWTVKAVSGLDFSEEVSSDDESSNFNTEGMLVIVEFTILVEDPDDFANQLEFICQDFSNQDDDYFFDYDFEEQEGGCFTLTFRGFEINTDRPDEFVDELDAFCQEYAIEGEYGFKVQQEEV